MKIKIVLIFLCCISVIYNCKEAEIEKPMFSVTFNEVGQIVEDKNNSDSYFERPEIVKVANDGNVYVLDSEKGAILKFKKDGSFVRKIGRSGRGPGELERPLIMLADSELVVISEGTKRADTFSLEGDYKSSYNLENLSPYSKLVRNWTGYLAFNVAFASDLDTTKILHYYDKEFNPTLKSEINVKHFFEEYTREDANIASGAVESLVFTDSVTLVGTVPDIYNGSLSEFKNRNGKWELNRKIPGKEIEKLYTLVNDEGGAEFMTFVFNKVYKYDLHSKSKGLFKLNNGTYVHFLELDVGDSLEYGVELFDQEWEYQGYSSFYRGSTKLWKRRFFQG